MKKQLSWLREGNILKLFGKLDQNFLIPLWNRRLEIMQGVTLIDLNSIICIDTAGIALLIHLVAMGKKQGIRVILIGLSNKILALKQLYNLPDDMFPH